MDAVNLEDLFQLRFPVLQSCPHHVRGRFRQANRQVLEAPHQVARSHDSVLEERAWKAFCILPMLLLRRPQGEGRVSKEELCRRCDLFAEGRWEILVDEAVACVTLPTPKREAPTDKQKAELACRKIRLGEVSRARHCLTGSPLAPGTEDGYVLLRPILLRPIST